MTSAHNSPRQLHPSPNDPQPPIFDLPTPNSAPLPPSARSPNFDLPTPIKPHTGVTRYDPEFAILICERIATTPESLAAICRAPDMPGIATIFRWLREHPDFQQLYIEAKQSQAEILIDQALEIVDDSSHDLIERPDGRIVANSAALQRSKMRVEFRKWIASKLLPRKYGYQKESSPAAAQARSNPHPSGTPGIIPMSEEERMEIIEQHLRETAEPPPGLDDPDAPIWGDWYPNTDPTESPEDHPADPIVPPNPNPAQPTTAQPIVPTIPNPTQPETSQPTVRTNPSPTEPASSQPTPWTPAKRPPSPPEHHHIREPKPVRSPMNKACS